MGPSPSAALHHAGMACILKPCVSFASHASRTNRPCDKVLARSAALRFDPTPRAAVRPPFFATSPCDRRSPLFPARHRSSNPSRPLQGRLLWPWCDGAAIDVVVRPAAAGGRDHPPHRARPRRAHGVDLSARKEPVESQDHDSKHGGRDRRRRTIRGALTAAHIRLAIGLIAGVFVLRHWLGARFQRLSSRP